MSSKIFEQSNCRRAEAIRIRPRTYVKIPEDLIYIYLKFTSLTLYIWSCFRVFSDSEGVRLLVV